jgi:hypothetical protein
LPDGSGRKILIVKGLSIKIFIAKDLPLHSGTLEVPRGVSPALLFVL